MITNNDIKFVKSLGQRKFRQKYNKFIAEGVKVCTELLTAQTFAVDTIYCTNEWAESNVSLLAPFKEKVTTVSGKDLGRMSQLKSANHVLVVMDIDRPDITDQAIGKDAVLYLADVQDPGNVGTIIRIADWYGIKHIVRSADTADFFTPKVVQASMASLANVKLYSATYRDLIDKLSNHTSVGAVLGGTSIAELSWPESPIIVMGNESKGIPEEVLSHLDQEVMIPGSIDRIADSLNVGIATAILCQHWFGGR